MQSIKLKSLISFILTLGLVTSAFGASHREAPMIAFDPAADNTDVYAFRSWENPDKVVLILNAIPGQKPQDGPNYFPFDDEVLYEIHVDNNQDGKAEDIVYQIRFKTETRPVFGSLNFPLVFVGNPDIPVPELQGITALDGPGSEGITRRQTYTVTAIHGGKQQNLFEGKTLVAVPSNVGSNTMPNYEALAAQGIYSDSETGIRVFAGQRYETFYADLGAIFDTLNLRRPVPALTPEEDSNDRINPFGKNRFKGFNINTIAIEVPIEKITHDYLAADESANPIIGVYASTSRQQTRILGGDNGKNMYEGEYIQVSRMANPLVNELIIDTPTKDLWNVSEPEEEMRFQEFYKAPSVATALNLVYGLPVPAAPRTDLMQVLLKYPGQPVQDNNCGSPCAELLRLNLSVPPTAPESQKRLGGLATPADPAGFPNGRRPNDDVVDIGIRVIGGQAFLDAHVGDGVNFLENATGSNVTANGIYTVFPFLPTPKPGRYESR